MKTTKYLLTIIMITLIGSQLKAQSLRSKEAFSLLNKNASISIMPGEIVDLEFEIQRSKKYQNRALEINVDQIPSGITAQVDKPNNTGNSVRITLQCQNDMQPGKHIVVISAHDKYKRKGIMVSILVEPESTVISTKGSL